MAGCTGVLLTFVSLESNPNSSEDLSGKCRRTLKAVVAKLTSLSALDALVHQTMPESVMQLVLEQVWISTTTAIPLIQNLFPAKACDPKCLICIHSILRMLCMERSHAPCLLETV